MIIEQKRNQIQRSGEFKTYALGMTELSKAHIFSMLRGSLYSNKIGSPIREISVNAIEAHYDAGTPELPIRVTLPSELEPSLTIRDYGKGLSDLQFQNVYSMYGVSTKNHSNEYTGGFGIGKFSVLSYCDSVVINSYQGGVKNSYNLFIDELNVGAISKIGESETVEHDGLEIVIPVDPSDIYNFAKECKNLFRHFPVRPIISNDSNFYSDIKEPEILFAGSDWKYAKNDENPRCVYGIVAYPIDIDALNSADPKVNAFRELSVLLRFPIGELDVTPSRESLQYSKKTIKAISDKLIEIYNYIESEMAKQLAHCKTMFEAKVKFGELQHSMDYFTFELFKQVAQFNGIKISSDDYKFDTAIVRVISYKRDEYHSQKAIRKYINGHRSSRYYSPNYFNLDVAKNPIVLIDDVGMENHRSRITQWTNTGAEVFIFRPLDKAKWAQHIIDIGFDIEPIKISSLKAAKIPNEYRGSYNSKHSSQCFIYAPENNDKYKDSDWYNLVDEDFELDDETGVYIEIEQFIPKGYFSNDNFFNTYNQAKQLLGSDIKLYAFKKKAMEEVRKNANYIEFSVWLKTQLQAYSIAPDKLKQWEEARYYNNELDYYDRNLIFSDSKLEVIQTAIKAGNVKNQEVIDAATALGGINKYLGLEYSNLANLFSRFDVPVPMGGSIKKEYNNYVKILKDNYPLLNYTSDYSAAKGVQEYIKMCELALDKP